MAEEDYYKDLEEWQYESLSAGWDEMPWEEVPPEVGSIDRELGQDDARMPAEPKAADVRGKPARQPAANQAEPGRRQAPAEPGAPAGEKKPSANLYVDMPNQYVYKNTSKTTGKPFYNVTLPAGTRVNDKDASGYRFIVNFAEPSKHRNGHMTLSLWKKKPVRLTKVAKDANGEKILGDDGKPVILEEEASVYQVKKGIVDQAKAYREANTVKLTVPAEYIEEKTYVKKSGDEGIRYIATMPAGSEVDGRDLSLYTFSAFQAQRDEVGNYVLSMPMNREVTLQRDLMGPDKRYLRDADGRRKTIEEAAYPAEIMRAMEKAVPDAPKGPTAHTRESFKEKSARVSARPQNVVPPSTQAPAKNRTL